MTDNWYKKAVETVTTILNNEGAAPGNSLHSWRCEHPDRYGPCTCVEQTAEEVVDGLVPVIVAAMWKEGTNRQVRAVIEAETHRTLGAQVQALPYAHTGLVNVSDVLRLLVDGTSDE